MGERHPSPIDVHRRKLSGPRESVRIIATAGFSVNSQAILMPRLSIGVRMVQTRTRRPLRRKTSDMAAITSVSDRKRVRRGLVAALVASAVALVGTTGASRASAKTLRPGVVVSAPRTLQASAGSTAKFPISLRIVGNAGTVALTVSGLPAGTTGTVTQLSKSAYELDVVVAANAPASTSTIAIQARSRAKLQTTTIQLQIIAAPAPVVASPLPAPTPVVTAPPITTPPTTTPTRVFTLRTDKTEATVLADATAAFGITIDRTGGYTGPLTFTSSGVPAGVTSTFAPNPTDTSGSVLSLTPSASTPDGRYAITVTGAATGNVTVRTLTVTLVVQNQPDFAMAVPATAVAVAGTTTNIVIGYTSLTKSGAVPVVTLSVAGLPVGANAFFAPNPTFGASTFVVALDPTTVGATYPLIITATAGTITHTYPLSLAVSGTVSAGFGLSASPAAFTAVRGTSASTTVTVTPIGGFNSSVSLGITGLPAGATATVAPNGTNAAIMTIAVNSAVPVGTYNLTITGTSGSLAASVAVAMTVT